MSNYSKYYQLRSSSIGRMDAAPTSSSNSLNMMSTSTSGIFDAGSGFKRSRLMSSTAGGLSAEKQKQHDQFLPVQARGNYFQGVANLYAPSTRVPYSNSPWRSYQVPSLGARVVTISGGGTSFVHRKTNLASSMGPQEDKTQVQQFSLEMQNESLRKEKQELESQMEKMQLHYTKQHALGKQEGMKIEREKDMLAGQLKEQDEAREKREKDNLGEKQLARKQRQEWEGKLDRITQYHNEQLAAKHDEVQKAKSQLQLAEINQQDAFAKLKIFETTNKDMRTKWEDDIRNFEQQLDTLNKQLLRERNTNEELQKALKYPPPRSSQNELETTILNLELKLRLERHEYEEFHAEIEIQQREQKIREKYFESLTKENSALIDQIQKLERHNFDKDSLVKQMLAHIEQIERDNVDLQVLHRRSNIDVLPLLADQAVSSEIAYFSNEFKHSLEHSRLLEEDIIRMRQLREDNYLQHSSAAAAATASYLREVSPQTLSWPITGAQQSTSTGIHIDHRLRSVEREQKTCGIFSPIRQSYNTAAVVERRLPSHSPVRPRSTFEDEKRNSYAKIDRERQQVKLQTVEEKPTRLQLQQHDQKQQQDLQGSLHHSFGTRSDYVERPPVLNEKSLSRASNVTASFGDSHSPANTSASGYLRPLRVDSNIIELNIKEILLLSEQQSIEAKVFEKQLEGTEVFDLVVGFVGAADSGKSTLLNSIKNEEWTITNCDDDTGSSRGGKMQINRYSCLGGKKVALMETEQSSTQPSLFTSFICGFSQVLVLFFRTWEETTDRQVYNDYVRLLSSELNFASELIVVHNNSDVLSSKHIDDITKDLTKLQEGLFRGKLDGKVKKINVYHIMLHDFNDQTKSRAIFDETVAVCRGTIIGKLASNKGSVDLFRRLNKLLLA